MIPRQTALAQFMLKSLFRIGRKQTRKSALHNTCIYVSLLQAVHDQTMGQITPASIGALIGDNDGDALSETIQTCVSEQIQDRSPTPGLAHLSDIFTVSEFDLRS